MYEFIFFLQEPPQDLHAGKNGGQTMDLNLSAKERLILGGVAVSTVILFVVWALGLLA